MRERSLYHLLLLIALCSQYAPLFLWIMIVRDGRPGKGFRHCWGFQTHSP